MTRSVVSAWTATFGDQVLVVQDIGIFWGDTLFCFESHGVQQTANLLETRPFDGFGLTRALVHLVGDAIPKSLFWSWKTCFTVIRATQDVRDVLDYRG
jgi:hypothetical protein